MGWGLVSHGAGVRRVWVGPPTPVLTAQEQQPLLEQLLGLLNDQPLMP